MNGQTTVDSSIERLNYIRAMLGELRTMASVERSDMLTYLIEMAYVEDSDVVRERRALDLPPPSSISNHQGKSTA